MTYRSDDCVTALHTERCKLKYRGRANEDIKRDVELIRCWVHWGLLVGQCENVQPAGNGDKAYKNITDCQTHYKRVGGSAQAFVDGKR